MNRNLALTALILVILSLFVGQIGIANIPQATHLKRWILEILTLVSVIGISGFFGYRFFKRLDSNN